MKKLIVDPPSGHRHGFPCELPEGKKYEDLLREKGYPEKDIEFALQYSRYWSEREEEKEE
jgi:sulfur carrier protein ThiS